MLNGASIAFRRLMPETGGLLPGLGALRGALSGISRRRRMRAVLRDLAEREDYLLADIGISRAWLDRALGSSAASAGWGSSGDRLMPTAPAAITPPRDQSIRQRFHRATLMSSECMMERAD